LQAEKALAVGRDRQQDLPLIAHQHGLLRRAKPGDGWGEIHRVGKEIGVALRMAASFAISSALSARLKTATPPIQPVKPTLRELWMTRPMVKGPPVPSLAGV
jgi:hypothetical protein